MIEIKWLLSLHLFPDPWCLSSNHISVSVGSVSRGPCHGFSRVDNQRSGYICIIYAKKRESRPHTVQNFRCEMA